MNTKSLHHVGIIVRDEHVVKELLELLGLEEEYRGYVPEYKSLCIFTKGHGGSAIEFVVPDGGNLSEYNGGKGGIHHIALLVDDVRAAQEELNKKGIELLEDIPVKGAGDFIVNFIRPRYINKILVELVEESI